MWWIWIIAANAEPCLSINNWVDWVYQPIQVSQSKNERIHTDSYNTPLDRVAFSEHFAVHWGADFLDTQQVQDILDVFEVSREVEVFGLGMPDLNTDRYFNVYLGGTGQDIPDDLGVAGYYDLDTAGNPMIVLGSYVTNSWSIAKTTIPHELFHALQHRTGQYQNFADRWYWESSAVWVEQEVFPNHPSHADFLFGYALYPHLPLAHYRIFSTGSTEEYHAYGSYIFLQYLTDNIVLDTTVGDSWNQINNDVPIDWWREKMVMDGNDLGVLLSEMSAHNVYWDYSNQVIYQNQVDAYVESLPSDDFRLVGTIPLVESVQDVPSHLRPGAYGYNHWRFESGEVSELVVDFEGVGIGDYFTSVEWRVQVVRKEDEQVFYDVYSINDGKTSIILDSIESEQELTLSVLADADTNNLDERFTYSIRTRFLEEEKRAACSSTDSSQWLWLSLLVYGRRRWLQSGSVQ